ncbi:MAG: peptide deformylase [Eubacteriales bacterium]|nr:peptide deformylase [Eubacteriales bacterium]
MALRNIVTEGDDILLKKCRPVEKFDKKLWDLLDDMAETLYDSGGVGLAGPQVGVMRRVCVIDIGEGLIEFINPQIIKTEGKHQVVEGCLSSPGEYGIVERPIKVKAKAFDRDGNEFEVEGEELFAQAMCHEFDHLDGVLFKSKVIRMLSPDEIKTDDDEE